MYYDGTVLATPIKVTKIIRRPSRLLQEATILVEFSVLRSSTYQVPVLWFTFNRIPSGVSAGIETVYQYIVPESARSMLGQIGVMGGISIAV